MQVREQKLTLCHFYADKAQLFSIIRTMQLRSIIIFIIIPLLIAGCWYYFLYPPMALKHQTQHALNAVEKSVKTKDRTKIAESLSDMLKNSAYIKLAVTFPSMAAVNNPATTQEFDRKTFLTFVDNVTYSLQDYSFTGQIEEFNLSEDRKTADITFNAQAGGDGVSYYSGNNINAHFVADTQCSGHVSFENQKALLTKLDCTLKLSSAPQSK